MKDRTDAGQDGCRTERMQDRIDAGKDECWTGQIPSFDCSTLLYMTVGM